MSVNRKYSWKINFIFYLFFEFCEKTKIRLQFSWVDGMIILMHANVLHSVVWLNFHIFSNLFFNSSFIIKQHFNAVKILHTYLPSLAKFSHEARVLLIDMNDIFLSICVCMSKVMLGRLNINAKLTRRVTDTGRKYRIMSNFPYLDGYTREVSICFKLPKSKSLPLVNDVYSEIM